MRRRARTLRWLHAGLALVPLLSGCRSTPGTEVVVSPRSSLLAVDVRFPVPLGRDPSLVEAFFIRGPIDVGTTELPEPIPPSFVKESRAYLLDPEPGTYSLVAVTSAVAAPRSDYPVAGGVSRSTLSGTIANAVILPAELIHRTRTAIGPGEVAFMGALRVAEGERIRTGALFRDDLQRQLAERIRPGASSASGISGWFTLAWMADLEKTTLRNEAADREAFLDAALGDLGASPWALVIARAAPPELVAARAETPGPEAKGAGPRRSKRGSRTTYRTQKPLAAEAQTAPPEAAAPARPERRRVPGIPPESPLAQIEIGMEFQEVRHILGEPDARVDRTTSKAWIPFYTGPGAYLRDWIYEGRGRVVFSHHGGSLEVFDVVYDPAQRK